MGREEVRVLARMNGLRNERDFNREPEVFQRRENIPDSANNASRKVESPFELRGQAVLTKNRFSVNHAGKSASR